MAVMPVSHGFHERIAGGIGFGHAVAVIHLNRTRQDARIYRHIVAMPAGRLPRHHRQQIGLYPGLAFRIPDRGVDRISRCFQNFLQRRGFFVYAADTTASRQRTAVTARIMLPASSATRRAGRGGSATGWGDTGGRHRNRASRSGWHEFLPGQAYRRIPAAPADRQDRASPTC